MSRRTRRIGVLSVMVVVLGSTLSPWPAAAASARPTGSTVLSDSATQPEQTGTSLEAAPTPATLSPFQDTGWRYQVVGRGGTVLGLELDHGRSRLQRLGDLLL